LLPIAIAATALGVYAFVVSIGVSYVIYGIPITVAHPLLFTLSIPLAILAVGALGLLMASVLVVYRYANTVASSSEYPVWLICGLLVPLTLLPVWVQPISWLLAPTWGMAALRDSALGGRALTDLGMCLVVTAAYAVLAAVFLVNFERLARRRATLALT
jgi:ABC-2 type transport system permease protein